MRQISLFLLATAVVTFSNLVVCPARVEAEFVTEAFTGTVSSNTAGYSAYAGAAVIGSFSYDTTAAVLRSDPMGAVYSTGTITLIVPSQGFALLPPQTISQTSVVHMPGVQDVFSITAGVYLGAATFTLTDSSGTSLSSTALPPALSFSPGSSVDLHYYTHGNISGFGVTITSLVAVPEPSSLILVGLSGVLSWFGWTRRNRRAIGPHLFR